MSIIISNQILQATHMSEGEILLELALLLYQKEKLSLGKASELAQMSRLQFQHLLASRQIPLNYDIAEFEADLATLASIKSS
ncbi:MAG: UPF0175 family protein [Anaerolineales bacterium]|nr:UPF0175 family protein [Anaerolineales bacterium]